MGGKKKGGGKAKGKGSAPPEEDDSIDKFYKFYKRKATELEIAICPIIKDKYEMFLEDPSDIPEKFHIWTELGWPGTRAIMDALREVKYQHCKSIRLWKTFCEDEGVRAVCQYLEVGKNVAFLELLDNNITELGCEFLSRALHPRNTPAIQILKLDHNQFGSAGVAALAEGLAVNPVLRMLSLTYCGIDKEGAEAIFEIMIYTRSAIEELNLSGNVLMNEGVITVLRGCSIAKSLKKILVADNQFSDDDDVMKMLEFCMKKQTTSLFKYDLKYNNIGESGKFTRNTPLPDQL